MRTTSTFTAADKHAARMELKRFNRAEPPQEHIDTYQPHTAHFKPPADHKLRKAHYESVAATFSITVEQAQQLGAMNHGGANRFNIWGRHNDEKQTTRTRAYRDSEAGQEAAAKADALYRAAVRAQSAAGIARMAALAQRRL